MMPAGKRLHRPYAAVRIGAAQGSAHAHQGRPAVAEPAVDLATALRNAGSPSDRAVVPQRWASWFEWAAPGVSVMVDSRIEVVPPSAWADYLVVAAGGPGTLEKLARIRASLVVVDRRDQGALLRILEAPDSGWRAVAEDEDGAVFRPAPAAGVPTGE